VTPKISTVLILLHNKMKNKKEIKSRMLELRSGGTERFLSSTARAEGGPRLEESKTDTGLRSPNMWRNKVPHLLK